MESLQSSRFKRRPEAIKSAVKVTGNITTANEPLRIMFASRYINRKLAILDHNIQLLALYALINDKDEYALVTAPIIQTVTPYTISDIVVDDTLYKVFYFNKGGVIIPNNKLIIRDNFMYDIFDEFFVSGNVPWYLDYEDISNIFIESKKYANSNIGSDPLAFEILSSIVARSQADKKVYYRQLVATGNKGKAKLSYVGLNNPYYSFDNTGAKLIGSRFNDGLNVALVEPEKKTSATSQILRA